MAAKRLEPEPEPERPKAVLVIGWGWIVLAGYLFFRSLLDLLVWRLLRPAAPALLGVLGERSLEGRVLRPILEHLTRVKIAEAIVCAAILFVAWQFLRLRSWAWAGMQAVCSLVLAYVLSFGIFWAWLWPKLAAEKAAQSGSLAGAPRAIGLVAGIGGCLAVGGLLIVAIAAVRSPRIRNAFRPSPQTAPAPEV